MLLNVLKSIFVRQNTFTTSIFSYIISFIYAYLSLFTYFLRKQFFKIIEYMVIYREKELILKYNNKKLIYHV